MEKQIKAHIKHAIKMMFERLDEIEKLHASMLEVKEDFDIVDSDELSELIGVCEDMIAHIDAFVNYSVLLEKPRKHIQEIMKNEDNKKNKKG